MRSQFFAQVSCSQAVNSPLSLFSKTDRGQRLGLDSSPRLGQFSGVARVRHSRFG
jgi:hypothetical protein